MSLSDAMFDAATLDMQISGKISEIQSRLARRGAIQFDHDEVNDYGGFTAICERTNREAGVFVSMSNPPRITIAVNLSDAHLLIVGDPNADRVKLEVQPRLWNRVYQITCNRAKSARDNTPLLMFETRLNRFTKQRENLCVWLITTLFERDS
jgi:hypothetical protein